MHALCLTLARLAAAAWVGAAALFVVTSVSEVRSPLFDTATKDALAALRFPWYYVFGFALVAAACLGAAVATRRPGRSPGITVATGLLFLALAAMVGDFVLIYRPLEDAITPPGQVRPTWFETYHKASMWINAAAILLTLSAAILLSRPVPAAADDESDPRRS